MAAGSSVGVVIAAGAIGALVAFALIFLLLCIVMYVGIPWACISLFRGAGIGNALAMSLSTAANVMSVFGRSANMSKGTGKFLSDLASKKVPSGGDDNSKQGKGKS